MGKKRKTKRKLKIPTRAFLLKYGLPTAIIPGIILAATFGFNWEKLIKTNPRNNPAIFANHQKASEVQDGDTIRLKTGFPIRLVGLDAPDKGEPLFNESRGYLLQLIDNKTVEIEYARVQNDNYGRLRGYAFVACDYPTQKFCQDNRLNLNVALVGAGLAEIRLGKLWQRPKYESELKEALKYAQSNQLGVWKK